VTSAQDQRDDDVDLYLPHLLYEIQQLGEMPALVTRFDAQGPATLKIACLESCLVHARLLIEFLMGRPKKDGSGRTRRDPGDIRPSMFTDSWHPPDMTMFDVYLDRLDKHLVHLSKDRGTMAVDDGGWAMDEIPRILKAMADFAQVLIANGSRHGPVIATTCRIALSSQPTPTITTTTASTSPPPEIVIIGPAKPEP
jgi:hypothetical protein